MNGMMTPSVSPGSSHRVARLTCTPHVIVPSGAAWSGATDASAHSPNARRTFTFRHVLARRVLERRHAADVDRLLVHALGPERKPTESAFQDAHSQAGIAIHDPGPDEGRHEAHPAPRMRGETAEKDVVPQILVAGEVG